MTSFCGGFKSSMSPGVSSTMPETSPKGLKREWSEDNVLDLDSPTVGCRKMIKLEKMAPESTCDRLINKNGKLPAQVARRNARERRRVEQVNLGFVTLRNHIPANGGKGAKKLSKVETLRAASQYIKYLQKVLTVEDPHAASESANGNFFPTCKSSSGMHFSTPSPSFLENFENGSFLAQNGGFSVDYRFLQHQNNHSHFDNNHSDGATGIPWDRQGLAAPGSVSGLSAGATLGNGPNVCSTDFRFSHDNAFFHNNHNQLASRPKQNYVPHYKPMQAQQPIGWY